ncbi:hypothetical protein DNH61_04865 [Paenibacillus sambharensis]|uniref:Uncharacterized protein n=1 Tax=Paenibacillus sambharensis TaxID=1803190 RepID=A0A2W1LZ78_9BACL|nr:hypothetical protein [Paenibacillus sambharensis]PZD96981.1 hypothetical protein DNH61_04865 [Paenibacillus sambharensis]
MGEERRKNENIISRPFIWCLVGNLIADGRYLIDDKVVHVSGTSISNQIPRFIVLHICEVMDMKELECMEEQETITSLYPL